MALDIKNIDLKDTKTQTVILMIILSGIAAALYILYVFLPQVTNDINIIGKTISMRGSLKETKAFLSEKDALKKKAQEYNEKIEVYEKKLPAQQEVPSLLEDLSKMARNANISIVGITPVVAAKGQKEKKPQVYQEIPILITAKSSYHELGRFLSNLENGDRFIKIVDISIKANAATPKKHDVELMVYTYVLPLE